MCVFTCTHLSRIFALALHSVTLKYKIGLDIVKMQQHIKNEGSMSRLSNVSAQTGHTKYRQVLLNILLQLHQWVMIKTTGIQYSA